MASLCVFFKIDSLVDHPVRGLYPAQYVLNRPTRRALAVTLDLFRCLGLELRCLGLVFALFCSVLCSIVEWVA